MQAMTRTGGTLQAKLCEIERGVFYATYADQDALSDADELTHYQTGASAAEAMRSLELHALTLGYQTVVWTETIVTPLFAPEGEQTLHGAATSQNERRA